MSTDQPDPEFVDERHDGDEMDPFGIVPDEFMKRYPDANSIAEALREAERDATKSDPDEFPRCPECLSTRLRKKPGHAEMAHKRPEDYKCTGCGAHFDEPAPSREAARPGEQATLPGVRER